MGGLSLDPIEIHRFGLAGREALLLLLAASLFTLVCVRTWTRLARKHGWRSGRVGDVHVHHLVVGIVLTLVTGMLDLAMRPGEFGRELLAIVFGVGAALILDEFALSLHLQDVYWTAAGRRSLEVSLIWILLGLLLLVGISPFGIHDKSEIPRLVGFVIVAVNIVLSVVTCLKGKLVLGLLSIFLPPVGVASAIRLARPGSVWAAIFYRTDSGKQERAQQRCNPAVSYIERLRQATADFVGGRHDMPSRAKHR